MNRMIIQTVREWIRRQPQAFFDALFKKGLWLEKMC
jgi:hypothetical protein